MKKILCSFVCILFFFFSILSRASGIDEMQTFYQKKDITLAKSILQDISDKKVLEKKQTAAAGVFGFTVGVLLEDATAANQLKSLKVSTSVQEVIESALKSVSASKGNIDMYAQVNMIVNPSNLDVLWGIFYATGSEKIPDTIRKFVEEKSAVKDQSDFMTSMLIMSAKWSLETNARLHPVVKKSFDKLKISK